MKIGDQYQCGIIFHLSENGGLIAQPEDYPDRPNWYDAFEAAQSYGEGWRLPTKDELNLLYQQKDVVGGFDNIPYWSSTVYDANSAWYQYFSIGTQNYCFKTLITLVRAVKTFTLEDKHET